MRPDFLLSDYTTIFLFSMDTQIISNAKAQQLQITGCCFAVNISGLATMGIFAHLGEMRKMANHRLPFA